MPAKLIEMHISLHLSTFSRLRAVSLTLAYLLQHVNFETDFWNDVCNLICLLKALFIFTKFANAICCAFCH
jgi:hypothetical protein